MDCTPHFFLSKILNNLGQFSTFLIKIKLSKMTLNMKLVKDGGMNGSCLRKESHLRLHHARIDHTLLK